MDGPLLFIAMCNRIHRNHLAFIESIKHKIDVDTSHNDLIPHILKLRNTTILLFQQRIFTWQRKYMENSLKVSPMKLVSMTDEECQTLKHSNQWVETIDPSIVAMKALVQGNMNGAHSLLEQLSAHLSSLTKDDKPTGNQGKQDVDNCIQGRGNDNPSWVYDTLTDKSQTHTFRGQTWYYCTKCGRDGKWVCSHPKDGYRSRSRSPPTPHSNSPMHNWSRSVSFRPTPPPSPRAKLSLLDSINGFMQEP
jgi:hypothetical protein